MGASSHAGDAKRSAHAERGEGTAKARQMRVCRASAGGLSGGQGPTRASHVYLTLKACPTRITFGFFKRDLLSFHMPRQPPLTS
jgi:hypothetical protein